MNLKYRGVDYNYTPPQVDMESTSEVGQYRGLEWRFRNPKKVPVLQPSLDLVYRGVAYQTGQTESVSTPAYVPAPVAPAVPSGDLTIPNMARALMTSHQKWIKNRQQTLLSRAAAEVGVRTDVAHS